MWWVGIISLIVIASNAFVHTNCKNHPFPLRRRWVVLCLLGGFPIPQERSKFCGYAILWITECHMSKVYRSFTNHKWLMKWAMKNNGLCFRSAIHRQMCAKIKPCNKAGAHKSSPPVLLNRGDFCSYEYVLMMLREISFLEQQRSMACFSM